MVEKDHFIELLNNYTALTAEETEELISLQKKYPYSQAIHNLVAKGSQTNNLPTKEKSLHAAAVFSTDRSVLKSIMTANRLARLNSKPSPAISSPATGQSSAGSAPALSGDDLLDELLHDMDVLKRVKHDFEVVAEAYEKGQPLPALTTPGAPVKKIEKTQPKTPTQSEGIIDEIKSTRKKIRPSDPRQQEQLDIIDQFIKTKPSISRNKPSDVAAQDLSESSNAFSENIISETLVEILIKQGKRDKAVEVLRKLIWKFPQKKAYFAAQIEELKS